MTIIEIKCSIGCNQTTTHIAIAREQDDIIWECTNCKGRVRISIDGR